MGFWFFCCIILLTVPIGYEQSSWSSLSKKEFINNGLDYEKSLLGVTDIKWSFK